MVLQLYSLSRLADLLGDGPAASRWAAEAQEHIRHMTELLFDAGSGAFLCIGPDGKPYKTGSLIRMLPLILGGKLPEHIRCALVNELKVENHYLTARGFATESVKSPLYDQRRGDADHNCAYWRGPIWAPVMVLLTKGLVRCGEAVFAREAARRFIAAMELETDTFRENYDALLPTGCDDDGFVWTAASYVLLKDEEFYREK
jgi:glycogen debranching enzyme